MCELLDPMPAILFDEFWVGENDGLKIGVIPGKSADKALKYGIHDRFFGEAFVQNAEMLFGQCLSTSEFFLDKEEGVCLGFSKKKLVHVLQFSFRHHNSIGENSAEVEDSNIVVKGMGGANDVVLRFLQERPDFFNVLKYLSVDFDKRLRFFPVDVGVIVVV
jgi:hypothetical protein